MSQQSRLTTAFQRIATEFKSVRTAEGGITHVTLTKAQYAAIVTKDANTHYYISNWDA